MESKPSAQSKEPPAPEVLHPREDKPAAPDAGKKPEQGGAKPGRPLRRTYRPSHKATFLGLAVIVAILAVNAAVIGFVLKSQSKGKNSNAQSNQVTISSADLSKLGVNRTSVGDLGEQLIVGPDAQFKGKVTIAGPTSLGGTLTLNSTFSAANASLAQLQSGNTTISTLNVNGNSSLTSAALRNNLSVAGTTTLQGPVTMTQLLTVNNNVNISGSLSVGGTMAINNLHASTVTADSTIYVGGHIITRGQEPGLSRGGCLGIYDTISNSGNDAAGSIVVNTDINGVNGGAGGAHGACILANISFRQTYSNIPHVIATAVGPVYGGSVYVFPSQTGFSLGVSGGLSATTSYAFDYIVEQ